MLRRKARTGSLKGRRNDSPKRAKIKIHWAKDKDDKYATTETPVTVKAEGQFVQVQINGKPIIVTSDDRVFRNHRGGSMIWLQPGERLSVDSPYPLPNPDDDRFKVAVTPMILSQRLPVST